jgi:hypothetical protein
VAALAWLAIPVAATVAAAGWVAWTGRARRTAEPLDSVASFERFRRAVDYRPPGTEQR